MLPIENIDNGFLAILAGMIISPHCVGMCGPLVCSFLPATQREGAGDWSKILYHLGRVVSYTAIGAAAGGLGLAVVSMFGLEPVRYFPWFLVGAFLLFAVGLDRWLPKVPGLRKGFRWLSRAAHKIPGPAAGLGLGLATPALPCAPLYSLFWLAMMSGSPVYGAEIALGFALGTIPLLWFSQSAFLKLRAKIGANWVFWLQRGIALVAAGMILWRVVAAGGTPMAADVCTFH